MIKADYTQSELQKSQCQKCLEEVKGNIATTHSTLRGTSEKNDKNDVNAVPPEFPPKVFLLIANLRPKLLAYLNALTLLKL